MGRKNRSRRLKRDNAGSNRHHLFYFFFGVLLLALPLVHHQKALDTSLMPRLTVISLLFLTTGLMVFGNKRLQRIDYSVFRHWIFPVLVGFALVTVLSAFFAYNVREVYFDILRTMVVVWGVALSVLLMLRTPGWQEKISRLAIMATIPTLIIGAVQYVQRVLTVDESLLPDGRTLEYMVTGLMGHKNIYSSFLMLLLPFTVFGIYKFRDNWRIFATAVMAMNVLMIILLKTRSAWVGILLGVFASMVLLILFARTFRLSRVWRNVMLALIAIAVTGLAIMMHIGRTADPFSVPGRFYSIIDAESQHNIHRLNVWRGTVNMALEHPLTGVGPGNWKVKAPQYYQQQFEYVEALNWLRPHNDFIWVFSEKGVAGFLLYLGVFGLCFFYLLRVMQKKPEDEHSDNRVFALSIAAGLMAYLADSFFSFPYERIEIQTLLFLMIAASVAMYHEFSPKKSLVVPRRWLLLTVLVIFGFGSYYGFQVVKSEVNSRIALGFVERQEWTHALHYADKARTPLRSMDSNGYPPEYFMGMALEGMESYTAALQSLKTAQKYAPNNIWVLNLLGKTYQSFERFDDAIICYEKILGIIPHQPAVQFKLAGVYYRVGEYQKAHNTLTGIKNWEEDPEIVNNVRILEGLLQGE